MKYPRLKDVRSRFTHALKINPGEVVGLNWKINAISEGNKIS